LDQFEKLSAKEDKAVPVSLFGNKLGILIKKSLIEESPTNESKTGDGSPLEKPIGRPRSFSFISSVAKLQQLKEAATDAKEIKEATIDDDLKIL